MLALLLYNTRPVPSMPASEASTLEGNTGLAVVMPAPRLDDGIVKLLFDEAVVAARPDNTRPASSMLTGETNTLEGNALTRINPQTSVSPGRCTNRNIPTPLLGFLSMIQVFRCFSNTIKSCGCAKVVCPDSLQRITTPPILLLRALMIVSSTFMFLLYLGCWKQLNGTLKQYSVH